MTPNRAAGRARSTQTWKRRLMEEDGRRLRDETGSTTVVLPAQLPLSPASLFHSLTTSSSSALATHRPLCAFYTSLPSLCRFSCIHVFLSPYRSLCLCFWIYMYLHASPSSLQFYVSICLPEFLSGPCLNKHASKITVIYSDSEYSSYTVLPWLRYFLTNDMQPYPC